MDRPQLLVKKLASTARLPVRASSEAAGYDLWSAQATVVPARGKQLVSTGLAITVPRGTYGRIAPRSGLAWKHFIDVGAGVCDRDYTGEVGVLLFNHSDQDFHVAVGDRVAQLILEAIAVADVVEVPDLPETQRGVGGFGSTGISKLS